MTNREKILGLKCNILGDKYEIISKDDEFLPVGQGGTGIVYEAKQHFSDSNSVFSRRAVKFFIYRDDLIEKFGYVPVVNFDAEIRNITRFSHQNVLKVIDGGYYTINIEDQMIRIPYTVTEFFDGPNLKDLFLPCNSEFCKTVFKDEETVFSLLIQIVKGIQYLHKNHFYHCDIAPKNIFLKADEDGEFLAVIGDLGSGKTIIPKMFNSTMVIGTREYMPENVEKLKNTEITYEQFCELQPEWDLSSTAKTILRIISNIKDSNLFNFDFWNLDRLSEKLSKNKYSRIDEILTDLEHLCPSSNQIFKLDELSEASRKINQVLIPINSVFLSRRMRKISKHDIMLRLMEVSQFLEGASIYPGANHTRYEHSLGTYELMRKAMLALLRNNDYATFLSEKYVIIGLLSALLSSIVYYPYSYAITELQEQEPELYRELAPRNVFYKLMNEKSAITNLSLLESINELFNVYQIDINSLEHVIFGKTGHRSKELDVLNAILNSSVGVRVMDYLMRDSHHIGLTYKIHPNDLFKSMSIASGEFCLKQTGITSAEQIITNRYWLFKRIYWSSPNRGNAALLKHLFFSSYCETFVVDLFNHLHEATYNDVLLLLVKHAGDNEESIRHSINLIQKRGQIKYKNVLTLDKASSIPLSSDICSKFAELNYTDQHKIRDEIEKDFIREFNIDESLLNMGVLVLVDMPFEKKGTKLGNDIRIHRYDNSYLELKSASGIVAGLNQSFQDQLMLLRVYIRPDIFSSYIDKEEQTKIEEYFKQQLHNLL